MKRRRSAVPAAPARGRPAGRRRRAWRPPATLSGCGRGRPPGRPRCRWPHARQARFGQRAAQRHARRRRVHARGGRAQVLPAPVPAPSGSRPAPGARRPACREIQMSSPATAAPRRRAWPGASSPNTVMQIFSGPLVVSPPISSQPKASASANRPCGKAGQPGRGRLRQGQRQGKGRRDARPSPPGRTGSRPGSCGPACAASAPAKKWRSSTSMSDEMAICLPGVGASSAQSSPMPSGGAAGRGRAEVLFDEVEFGEHGRDCTVAPVTSQPGRFCCNRT